MLQNFYYLNSVRNLKKILMLNFTHLSTQFSIHLNFCFSFKIYQYIQLQSINYWFFFFLQIKQRAEISLTLLPFFFPFSLLFLPRFQLAWEKKKEMGRYPPRHEELHCKAYRTGKFYTLSRLMDSWNARVHSHYVK